MLHNTQIRREAEHLPIQAGRRTLLKGAGGLALAHVAFAAAPVHGVEAAPRAEAATPVPGGQPDTLAIDCLLEPDKDLVARADAINARLRKDYPEGYSLDASHAPHISVAQRFVRAADFDKVTAAVAGVLAAEKPIGWPLKATGFDYAMWAGVALTVMLIERTPELEHLQQAMLDALAPYTVESGTAAAFATSPESPDINADTIAYVKTFVPAASGKNFIPHVTVGVAHEAFVKSLEAEPFETFTATVAGSAIYHLGDFGAAAKQLWRWDPEDAS